MKRLFTILTVLFAVQHLAAQYVIVNSPASIAGSKTFSAAAFGADLTSNVWTADVVFVNDGSAPNPAIGCASLTNAAAIAGKIALIDRGTCSFSQKCSNAEAAGAIGVVVFNNTPGTATIAMGVTAGFTVTIPCVMLSYNDGQIIRAELMNGPVNMTIGNVKFPNDVHTDIKKVLNAPNGTMPALQAAANGFSFIPGLVVQNNGLNAASDVTVAAAITHTPPGGSSSSVYAEEGVVASLASDSSAIVELPVFTPSEGEGIYEISYTVTTDSVDNVDADNSISSQFSLTKNVFAKGRWDEGNERPYQTNAYRPSTSTKVEFIAGFEVPKGAGYSLDSIQFYMSTAAVSLKAATAGSKLNIYLYEWNDANANDGLDLDEFTAVSIVEPVFTSNTLKSAWVTVPTIDLLGTGNFGVPVSADGAKYFVGVRYEGDSTCFFGFDESYDHTAAIEVSTNILVTDINSPYFGTTVWDGNGLPDLSQLFYFTGLRAAFSTALYINPVSSGTKDELAIVSLNLLPNPVSEQLIAEVNLVESTSSIEYSILDVTGRLVSRSVNDVFGSYDKAQFDVSNLTAGQYFLKMKTDKGSKSTAFTVQH